LIFELPDRQIIGGIYLHTKGENLSNHHIVIITLIFVFAKSAYGATCIPGTYLPNPTGNCTICPQNSYCPGDDTASECPPETYSSPGAPDINFCFSHPEKQLTLHIGNTALRMWPNINLRPALATLSSSGEIFYAPLSKHKCSNVKVQYKDAILSVCSADNLPSPYTEIDYIESTGTQYLDTGYTINKDDSAEIIMTATGLQDGQIAWTGANAYLQLRLQNGWAIKQTSDVTPYGAKDDIHITYTDNTESLYVNQKQTQSINWTSLMYKQNVKIAIFKLGDYDNNGTFNTPATKMKLYSYKLILNDAIVRDMIPVLDYYGRPCMFDKISGEYLYNAGTDEFLYATKE